MTREETCRRIDDIDYCLQNRAPDYSERDHEAMMEAKKVLEQEPILDKITELIEPLRHLSIDEMSDIEWDILRMIDKYKEESEEV